MLVLLFLVRSPLDEVAYLVSVFVVVLEVLVGVLLDFGLGDVAVDFVQLLQLLVGNRALIVFLLFLVVLVVMSLPVLAAHLTAVVGEQIRLVLLAPNLVNGLLPQLLAGSH